MTRREMCGREKEQLVIHNMLNYLSNMVETKFVLWQREPSYTTQIRRNAAKLIVHGFQALVNH